MTALSRSEEWERTQLLKKLYEDRPLAHKLLFAHRRPDNTPPFHDILIRDWHDVTLEKVLDIVFRGGAKSTIAEEAILILVGFREFANGLILGETEDRAIERLRAIRHEVETNELVLEVFGDLMGPTWTENELIFSNGVRLLAMGRGQAIRGVKHNDKRPDMLFIDDVENRGSVKDPEQRQKTRTWFFTELLPACDTKARVRMAATPLDPDALAVRLTRDPEWVVHNFPIQFINEQGTAEAIWPERYDLAWIERRRAQFARQGLLRDFMMEYMCTAVAPEDRSFTNDMVRVEPQVRTWQAVYAMFDPARTTNAKSATTGYACWSWIGNKLVVWDAWGKLLMPDAIVSAIFDCALHEQLRPTLIGVEEDGLNEFLLQPIRQEMIKRGVTIPYKALRAPKGKLDFIRGLQPFFKAREVHFAKPLPDLVEQLLGFPTGNIDVPNALAYALKLRPGAAIFDDFSGRHVASDIRPSPQMPIYLALNATSNCTTGVLVQYVAGAIRVYGDWVLEGDVGVNAQEIVAMAQLLAGKRIRMIGGPIHFDQYNNVGLRQALARIPAQLDRGGICDEGRAVIRSHLQREVKGMAALQVSEEAGWTLNGFAGGYARSVGKGGIISNAADEGPYRTLMEGLESFAAVLRAGSILDDDGDKHFDYTPSGVRYQSARR